jgi:hypothetical protein
VPSHDPESSWDGRVSRSSSIGRVEQNNSSSSSSSSLECDCNPTPQALCSPLELAQLAARAKALQLSKALHRPTESRGKRQGAE